MVPQRRETRTPHSTVPTSQCKPLVIPPSISRPTSTLKTLGSWKHSTLQPLTGFDTDPSFSTIENVIIQVTSTSQVNSFYPSLAKVMKDADQLRSIPILLNETNHHPYLPLYPPTNSSKDPKYSLLLIQLPQNYARLHPRGSRELSRSNRGDEPYPPS